MKIAVGEPSWLQVCASYGHAGVSFVAYEIFPVTVYAAPGTAVTLSTGHASPSPEQIQMGINNNTIWTGFNPVNLTTDALGTAHSNLTLTGAVMPFVPNDIANVSLPIVARSVGGVQAEAGLPIEFTGGEGFNGIHVLQTSGPILFPGTMIASASNGIQYAYGIAYAPAAGAGAQPIQVTLGVAGTWSNGAVGSLPSGIQVTFPQPSFVLSPDQVFYFFVDENNSIPQSPAQAPSNYTFAIQESIGGTSYVEPLSLSVVSPTFFGSFGTSPTTSGAPGGGASQNWTYLELGLVAAAAVAVLLVGTLFLRRRRPEPIQAKVAG